MQVLRKIPRAPSTNKISRSALDSRIERILVEVIQCLIEEEFWSSFDVSHRNGDKTTQFIIRCRPNCFGKVLGAKGRTIQSMRTLIMAMTAKDGYRSVIEIEQLP